METHSTSYFHKWQFFVPVLGAALLLSHLDILENGFSLPTNYLFPFNSFVINAFYIVLGVFIFQVLYEFLNRKLPWSNGFYLRLFVQFSVTLLIYLIFQYLIIFGIEPTFNHYHSTPILTFFTFGIGVFLVFLANLVTLLFHFHKKAKENIKPTDFLQGNYKGKKMAIPKADFQLFYIQSGIILGITNDFQKIILKETLTDLEKIVDKQLFFRANRKQIIARKAIQKIAYNTSESAEIELKGEQERVIISRRRIPSFRKWVNQGQRL